MNPRANPRRQRPGPLTPIFDVPMKVGTVPPHMRRPALSPLGLPIESEHRITKARLTDDLVEYTLIEDGQPLVAGLGSDDEDGRSAALVDFAPWFVLGPPPMDEGDDDS